jgi:hypothetical protein
MVELVFFLLEKIKLSLKNTPPPPKPELELNYGLKKSAAACFSGQGRIWEENKLDSQGSSCLYLSI